MDLQKHPASRHFTSRLQKIHRLIEEGSTDRSSKKEMEDLELWRYILKVAEIGININIIVFQETPRIYLGGRVHNIQL